MSARRPAWATTSLPSSSTRWLTSPSMSSSVREVVDENVRVPDDVEWSTPTPPKEEAWRIVIDEVRALGQARLSHCRDH